MRTIETPIQKRFADIDVFRHVNNIHQQAYLDVGKTDYYTSVLGLEALGANPTLMIVSVRTDFAGQIRHTDPVVVRTWVEKIGTKSVTMRQQLVCGGEVRTENTTVMVCYDRQSGQTVDVPDEWRALI